MSSKSSNSRAAELVPVGRITGHRGNAGELTVRVWSGESDLWLDAPRFWIATAQTGEGRYFQVQRSRSYRDRLVLKLQGIDDGNAAAQLRGRTVSGRADESRELAEGVYHASLLVGMRVEESSGKKVGTVLDIVPTGGADLLSVQPEDDEEGEEILIPMVDEFLLAVEMDEGRIEVRLPDELRELNRKG